MNIRFLSVTAAVLAVAAHLAGGVGAGHHGCSHCGCSCECTKVCRLVREEKKVPIVCWGAKCEDFCVPCPSDRGCKHCEEVCDPCDKGSEEICTASKKFVWYDWCPGGTNGINTKKKLMKKTITKTIPSYKWVVEDLCAKCEEKQPDKGTPPAGAKVPPVPLVGVKLIYGSYEE